MSQIVFRQTLPVIITSFVNKCGDMGMRLFPMLLVEREFTIAQSSMTMGIVKSAGILAVFFGGILGDILGARWVTLLSFGISGVGLSIIPFVEGFGPIALVGAITVFGQGLIGAPLRLLLIQSVAIGAQKEGLAWLRTGQNSAVLVANGIAYLASGFGLAFFFIFDAMTAFLAIGVGLRILPRNSILQSVASSTGVSGDRTRSENTLAIALVTLTITGFMLLMEVFFVTAAVQSKRAFGDTGIAKFAQIMMINTFLCATFNVFAARLFSSIRIACSTGIVMQALAVSLILIFPSIWPLYIVAVVVQTIGELGFTSVAQHLLLSLIPRDQRQGKVYGASLFIQFSGKAVGAALAFPLMDWGRGGVIAIFMLAVLAFLVVFSKGWSRLSMANKNL